MTTTRTIALVPTMRITGSGGMGTGANKITFNFKQNSVVVGSITSKLPQFVTGETLPDAVQPYCVF
jgi:hypothetical protein